MSKAARKIYFVHEGKAAYPEIAAYRRYFEGLYESVEISPAELAQREDLSESIVWMVMGFYPVRPSAALVVHDYRSLSVGRWRRAKDRVKRLFNATPDLRIFQNETMRATMGFRDHVPTLFLPMGVIPDVLDLREEPQPEPAYDFAYIGVMSSERRSELMLDSFLRRYGESKTFHLFGVPEPEITSRYAGRDNVVFRGSMEQRTLFAELLRARATVNYFPTHFPHCLQTPTKMLDYAALGLRILSNEQPQSRLAAQTYGIQSLWGPAHDIFQGAPEGLDWPDNRALDPSAFLWPSIITRSGIVQAIEKALAR